jgi:hypothetical protein
MTHDAFGGCLSADSRYPFSATRRTVAPLQVLFELAVNPFGDRRCHDVRRLRRAQRSAHAVELFPEDGHRSGRGQSSPQGYHPDSTKSTVSC